MNRYDLICSLGGNCSVAHNLLYRRLRKFALPFDWTYFEDISAIYKLAESFEVKFADQLKKENLVELPVKILFIKRGVKINIFPIIRTTVFSVKLYLFGLKFNFTLGKERN